LLVWIYQFFYESKLRLLLQTSSIRIGLAAAMFVYLCICSSGAGTFIYFQF
jgi:hypothetical protein